MSKIPSSKNPLIDEDEEDLLDEVKGKGKGAKKKLTILNSKKLTKSEMDIIFLPEDFKDDEVPRE